VFIYLNFPKITKALLPTISLTPTAPGPALYTIPQQWWARYTTSFQQNPSLRMESRIIKCWNQEPNSPGQYIQAHISPLTLWHASRSKKD